MKQRSIILLLTPLLWLCVCQSYSQTTHPPELYLEPIIKVDFGDATADKPQSKSWINDHRQWLVVADEFGPKLWMEDSNGWSNQSEINGDWHGLPNKADVWSKGDDAYMVLVGECELNVVHLSYSSSSQKYSHQWKVDLPIPQDCASIETATITRDSKGQYWVCSDMNEKVMVWHSSNGQDWSKPITLADNINADDISLIVSLKDQVSAIWSNQNTQSIVERIHMDGHSPDRWSDPIMVQEGDNNADDHLNATVFENGELALVTKNSVDELFQPQFVLRLRDVNGNWTNISYEKLTKTRSPSRPIINHTESGKIFGVHAVRNRETNRYFISINEIVKKNSNWEFVELIQLKTEIKGKNGDVTSSKASFLPNEAKLIFFSDDMGNVYSFDLDTLSEK